MAVLPQTEQSSLTKAGNGTYTREFKDGTTETYDAAGRLTSIVEAGGGTTTLTRDGQGRITTISNGSRSLILAYDASDKLSTLSGPLGILATYRYNSTGDLEAVDYPDGGGFRFEYDASGQILLVTDQDGLVIEKHTYDSEGRGPHLRARQRPRALHDRLHVLPDRHGHRRPRQRHLLQHDRHRADPADHEDHRALQLLRRWCRRRPGKALGLRRERTHHVLRRRQRRLDVYLGRPEQPPHRDQPPRGDDDVHVRLPRQGADARAPPAAGSRPPPTAMPARSRSRRRSPPASNRTTTLTYTAEGKVETVQDPRGKTTSLDYDSNGDLETVTDPLTHETSFTYDAMGRRTSVTDALNHTTTTTYDVRGRPTRIENEDGTHTDFTYDRSGRRTSVSDPLGRLTLYGYDVYGRLETVTDPMGGITRYGYDLLSQLVSLTDAMGRTTGFEYDRYGRVVKVVYPGGAEEELRIRQLGPALEEDRPQVRRHDLQLRHPGTAHGQDLLRRHTRGQLHLRQCGAARDRCERHGHAHLDIRPRGAAALRGEHQELLDGRLHLRQRRQPPDAEPERDALRELRLRRREPADDDHARVEHVRLRLRRGEPPDVDDVPEQHHDQLQLRHPQPAHEPERGLERNDDDHDFGYTYDDAGNRLSKTTPDFTEAYAYDPLYRLTGVDRTGSLTGIWRYGYDAVGNRTTAQTDNSVLTSLVQREEPAHGQHGGRHSQGPRHAERAGDGEGQRAPGADASREHVRSDGRGDLGHEHLRGGGDRRHGQRHHAGLPGQRLRDRGDVQLRPQRQPDAEGRGRRYLDVRVECQKIELKRVLKNSVEQARFAYDPIGRRVEKVAGGVTSSWTYDGADILRQISGGTTLKYVHGPGIDEPLATDDGSALSHLHADGLGSMGKTTSAAGAVTLTRRYDAWGNLELGAATSGYAFTGREWDPETGLYYYRARYYDPKVGRFISEDPIGLLGGLHLYRYADNAPTNAIDPYGEFIIVVPAAAAAMGYAVGTTAAIVTLWYGTKAIAETVAPLWAKKKESDEEIRERKFPPPGELTKDEKKDLRDKKQHFPKEDNPADTLDDIRKTQEGHRKGGKDIIETIGKTGQKLPGVDTGQKVPGGGTDPCP